MVRPVKMVSPTKELTRMSTPLKTTETWLNTVLQALSNYRVHVDHIGYGFDDMGDKYWLYSCSTGVTVSVTVDWNSAGMSCVTMISLVSDEALTNRRDNLKA